LFVFVRQLPIITHFKVNCTLLATLLNRLQLWLEANFVILLITISTFFRSSVLNELLFTSSKKIEIFSSQNLTPATSKIVKFIKPTFTLNGSPFDEDE
jgi:hypothetical protein